MNEKTIAAIATAQGAGGIGIIRISGCDALEISQKVFKSITGRNISEMKGYTAAYGHIYDGDELIDSGVLLVYLAPHSYTGENVAEISCHGGLYVTKRVLRAVLNAGASMAEAGEFTKRAFLNGNLDLTQAESVMDIISATGERELKVAENLRRGAAFKKVKSCSEKLLKILGDLSAWTDYPEDDIPEVEPQYLCNTLMEVNRELNALVVNYDSGRILREGIQTVIIGRPNVGKSTLFNCLSGFDRSIVTDIAGTTRDVVEETVRLGDITLRLCDTAGIHRTDDIIEEKGIEIAEELIDSAELVLAVFDGGEELNNDDLYLINKINNKNIVFIINKSDKEQKFDTSLLKNKSNNIVYVSAKKSEGINELKTTIENLFEINEYSLNNVSVANERQKKCIDSAILCIDSAIEAIKNGEFLDAVNVLVDEAEQFLLSLTGEKVTDVVVDEVFSRFCVGK